MDLIIEIVLGAVAGWVATKLMDGKQDNWIITIVLGIVGSLVGGFIAKLIGLGGSLLVQLLIAVGGACLVIWALRKLKL